MTPWSSNYRMFFDHNKVETIVYNLLSNAVKYTPDNGVIEVKPRPERRGTHFPDRRQWSWH